MAAVRVVLPWSTWPMVPMFTWGFVLSTFSLLMSLPRKWSPDPGLNWRPHPYQGCALPTELSGPSVRPLRWSGKRDSNPRHSAWKADALPSELFPHGYLGGGWIRTNEGVEPADLQSAPFGRLGTPPSRCSSPPRRSLSVSSGRPRPTAAPGPAVGLEPPTY